MNANLPGDEEGENTPDDQSIALRAIDANLNRCQEAFRVIEDALRFGGAGAHLAGQFKNLRHAVSELGTRIRDAWPVVQARDVDRDPGTAPDYPGQHARSGVAALLKANLSRAGEALRSIEEFSKCLGGPFSRDSEAIRYRLYKLEQTLALSADAHCALEEVRLYVLLGAGSDAHSFAATVEMLCAAGTGALQLRDKSCDDRTLLARAREMKSIASRFDVKVIVNDRVDIALAAGADGVHLGQEDLPVADARRVAAGRLLIGVSTHTIEQARQAENEGAHYLGVGPVFPSGTKSFDSLAGLDLVRAVAAEITIPCFAIGGITSANAAQVVDAGIDRVAVAGGILHTDRPLSESCRALLDAMSVPPRTIPGAFHAGN